MKTVDGGYLTFSESAYFNDKQLAVTYEHAEPWAGPVPLSAEKNLSKTFAKLKAKQPLKLVVFGDSISIGASASGKGNRAPWMPIWADLVADELGRVYGSTVDLMNPSLGGMRADWGKDTVDGLVSFQKPDLVILGFGMNDAGSPFAVEQFVANTQAMMDSVRKQNPSAEFILLMSFQPNSKWRSLDLMTEYLAAFKKLEGPGVAVADMWSMHGYLLQHKTYWDMTGNHVNHPNDFLVRVYAQTVLETLGVE
ncbi:MAG: SGNH/GDSL hydrolase family protein [Kiritimatiellaceae bacterium]|nr:SGNH/GDSL hydrolase family protein [Kiritimatiellaceae bacterium]